MKILYIIGTSQYDSTGRFLREMAEQMRTAGWLVDVLDGRDIECYEQRREQVIQKQYDVIFTINGMILEEDSRLGEELLKNGDTIYCTYLMDHPLVHDQRLKNNYPRIFVLSPDRNHVAYTDTCLKNIWGTAFLPHAGCQGKINRPYLDRNIPVSFMGSYVSCEKVKAQFQQFPQEMCQLMEATANILIQKPEHTLEEALGLCLKQNGIELQPRDFSSVLSEFRVVDRYIRSYYREAVIRTLVEAGIPVDVYGDGWENFHTDAVDYLHVHPAISYEESLDIIGDSKISLNVMPWFKDGSHDRVFTAMLNGAVCLTDGSRYLEEQLRETEHIYFYSLKGLKYLPAKVRKILRDDCSSARVAEQGKAIAERYHTWANRADEVIDYLEQISSIQKIPNDNEVALFHQEVIHRNISLLRTLAKSIQSLRQQDYLHAMRQTTVVLDQLTEILPLYLKWKDTINMYGDILEENALLLAMQEILDAQQRQDYVWLADLFELKLLPFVKSMQEAYAGIADLEDTGLENYRIELTSSGAYTLAMMGVNGWQYLHTNGDPFEEGRILAESWFDREHYDYVVYGLGLGYHIQALLEIDVAITVTVIEADVHVISLAGKYGVTSLWDQTGRVKIISDPDHTALVTIAAQLDDTQRFVIHYPSMVHISNQTYRDQLEDYFIEFSSAQTQLTRLSGNFIKNKEFFQNEVSELQEKFENKTVYIIAAGPSLDLNMQELKNIGDDGVILATGTVLKKMLAAGIQPDYVIIIDAGRSTYIQTEGLAQTEIPLLYLSTVYYQIPLEYPGEKYVIFQQGYEKSEEYAAKHGYEVYESGGSVTTTALDISIRMGAKCIVLVGADLAYTGGRNHASDTAKVREIQNATGRMVEDIHGNLVMTAKNLNLYRKWIERRIAREKSSGIQFIDATEGGARICGTKLCKLKDVVQWRKNTR